MSKHNIKVTIWIVVFAINVALIVWAYLTGTSVDEINQILVWVLMFTVNVVFIIITYRFGSKMWQDLKGDDGKHDTKELLAIVAVILLIVGSELVLFLKQFPEVNIFYILLLMAGIGVGGKILTKQVDNGGNKKTPQGP